MNESYWQKTSQHPCFKQLNKDIKTDILIIGGGLSGISCAYQLKETGKQITIVEKNLLGSHTSGHTTAKITLLQDLIYQKLVKHYNIETAYLYYQSQKEAMKGIKDLIEKEKIDKQNLEMIERTIMNQCSLLQIDESTISRDKYVQMLNNGVGLGDVVSAITTEINAIKKNADAVLEYQKKRNQKQLESQKKEATLQHQKEIEAIKKQQAQNINSEDEYENFYRGDEIIAKANDKYVVTEIKRTPEKYLGKKWTKTFEFTGDLASLQMLNRYMDFLKQTKEFDFKQVDIITKLLADPNTGAVGKYNVKEVN